jgi:hypothetical protein
MGFALHEVSLDRMGAVRTCALVSQFRDERQNSVACIILIRQSRIKLIFSTSSPQNHQARYGD